jgi:hypothetical protein
MSGDKASSLAARRFQLKLLVDLSNWQSLVFYVDFSIACFEATEVICAMI